MCSMSSNLYHSYACPEKIKNAKGCLNIYIRYILMVERVVSCAANAVTLKYHT